MHKKEINNSSKKDLEKIKDEELEQIILELETNHIELEVQNEELRRIQNDLEISRSRYSELFNFAPIGYFLFNLEMSILEVNIAGLNMLSYTKKDNLLNRAFSTFVLPEYQDAFYKHVKEITKTRTKGQTELAIKNRNGKEFFIRMISLQKTEKKEDGLKLDLIRSAIIDISDIKNTESKLKHEKERVELLYKLVPNAIFSVDTELRITSWNDRAYEITGYSPAEVIGKRCIFFKECEHGSCHDICALFDDRKKKPIIGQEIMILHKNGSPIAISMNIDVIKDNKGDIIGGIESFEDITEKRKIREDLLRFKTALNSSSDNIFLFSLKDLKFIDVNQSACVSLGYTRSELLKMGPHDIKPDYDKEKIKNLLRKLKATANHELKIETRHERKDKSTYYVEITLKAITNNNSKGNDNDIIVVAVARDITERKEFETTLQENEQKFRAVSTGAQDGIIIINNNDEVIFWNDSATDILGYSKEEVMKKSLHKIIAPERYLNKSREAFHKWQKAGKGNAIGKITELAAKRKDGKELIVELSLSTVKLQNSYHAVGIMRDVTERKKAEIDMKNAFEKERELNTLKTRFISTVSHEFRTPLAGIQSSASLIEKYGNLWPQDKQEKLFRQIYESVKHMTNMLEGVSFIGKDHSGKLEIKPKIFDFEEILYDIIEEVKSFFKGKTIINHHSKSKIGTILMDTTLLRHILTNVLSNAVKYSLEKNPVEIITDNIEDKNMLIRVKDDGIGIPKEELKLIFESFHRASNVGNIKGTGLGMAIIKRSVDLCNGTIQIKSQINKGTIVSISLPINRS